MVVASVMIGFVMSLVEEPGMKLLIGTASVMISVVVVV